MDSNARKPRKTETVSERKSRLEAEGRKALDRALSEQDELDAMVRRNIEAHGA
jgi:hypothetical protein